MRSTNSPITLALIALMASVLGSQTSVAAEAKAPAEGVATFAGLQSLHLKKEDVTLFYDPQLSQVLTTPHPRQAEMQAQGIFIARPLSTQLLGKGKGFFTVECDSGPSWDPSCSFYQERDGKPQLVAQIPGLRFALPGDGSIYVEGHNDTMFNQREKYTWQNGRFIAVKQAFHYVGLRSTTRHAVDIYATQDAQQIVAKLAKNTRVEVLLNDGEYYLLKTPFGLLGWLRIATGTSQEESPLIGVFFAGD